MKAGSQANRKEGQIGRQKKTDKELRQQTEDRKEEWQTNNGRGHWTEESADMRQDGAVIQAWNPYSVYTKSSLAIKCIESICTKFSLPCSVSILVI
jgi:hypothetical protein